MQKENLDLALEPDDYGGQIYQALEQGLGQAAQDVRSRIPMVIRRREKIKEIASQASSETRRAIKAFAPVVEPVTTMLAVQLEGGRRRKFQSCMASAPKEAKEVNNALMLAERDLGAEYGPLIGMMRESLGVSTRKQMDANVAKIEKATVKFCSDYPELPVPLWMPCMASNIHQPEIEFYLCLQDGEKAKEFIIWAKRIDELHARSRVKKHGEPLILDMVYYGGWGGASISCGQAFPNVGTFYLLPEAMKESAMAENVFRALNYDPSSAKKWVELSYMIHEYAHRYYQYVPSGNLEPGPDSDVIQVLLEQARDHPEDATHIIAVLVAVYAKDVFKSFTRPSVVAYTNSSRMGYDVLHKHGLVTWNDEVVALHTDAKRINEAIGDIELTRSKFKRVDDWIVPPLPATLPQLFRKLNLPVE